MSVQKQSQVDAAPPRERSKFITSSDGRTVYYPNGPSFGGYAVPDAGREQTLREAAERLDRANRLFLRYFFWAAGLASLFGFYLLLLSPSLEALWIIAASIALALLLTRCSFSWFIGRYVRGLQRVPGDPKVARNLRYLALAAVFGGALVWSVLHLYDLRIAALPVAYHTLNFYPDLSRFIVYTIFGALLLLPALMHFDRYTARVGSNRALLGIMVLSALEIIAIGVGVATFFGTRPKVVITDAYLACGRSITNWRDVAAVSLVDGRRGKEFARLALKTADAPQASSQQFVPLLLQHNGPATSCEISGLHEDYDTIYAAIQTAWKNASAALR